jgi:hypothetical protein
MVLHASATRSARRRSPPYPSTAAVRCRWRSFESVFVEGRRGRAKGEKIAERLTERWRLNEMSAAGQDAWLRRLHRARNDAAHEGRDFVNDLEVERLADLEQHAPGSVVPYVCGGDAM